jgi:ribosomal protein S18 acetylase RimI-like enzyme
MRESDNIADDFEAFRTKYLAPFTGIDWRFDRKIGFIVWRRGSGLNVELLHVSAKQHGQGLGLRLIRLMVDELARRPPYHSVFGFTRSVNEQAMAFYRNLGFTLTEVPSVYRDGTSVLFSQSFASLRDRLQELSGA